MTCRRHGYYAVLVEHWRQVSAEPRTDGARLPLACNVMLVRPLTHEEPTILPLEINHTLMSVYERIAQVINVSPALRVAACAVFCRGGEDDLT